MSATNDDCNDRSNTCTMEEPLFPPGDNINAHVRADGSTILHLAAQLPAAQPPASYDKFLRALLAKDDIDVNAQDDEGRTPLHVAMEYGNTQLIKLLVTRHDIRLDLKDKRGRNPLGVDTFPYCVITNCDQHDDDTLYRSS